MKKKEEELKRIADKFEVIKVHGRKHVITQCTSYDRGIHSDPNYLGTGKALVGVLRNQTLQEFRDGWVIRNK